MSRAQRRAIATLMVVIIAQLWLWNIRIPDTPGSPGARVFWTVKAGAIFVSAIFGVMAIGSLIGARSRARTKHRETRDGPS
jgi:polyferredoxin